MICRARFRIAVLFCVLLASCGEKKDIPGATFSIPDDSLISQDKMVLILADVHVVEAALLLDRNEGKMAVNNPDFYYKGIFKKYHISRARYEQNLEFYRQNPENYAKIYDKVIGFMEKRQKKIPGPD